MKDMKANGRKQEDERRLKIKEVELEGLQRRITRKKTRKKRKKWKKKKIWK